MGKKINFKTLAVCIATLAFSLNMNAQGGGANTGGPANQVPGVGGGAGGPGDGNGPGNGAGQGLGPQNGGKSIPLDGGLSILILGAAAFGIKKLREK